jgi:hypothetical protein
MNCIMNLLYRFIYQNCVNLCKYIRGTNNVCITLDLYWVIKVNQDFCNSADLLSLFSAGHVINKTSAVYTRYTKKRMSAEYIMIPKLCFE